MNDEHPVSRPLTVEVCVDSARSALAAAQGGAHRVELCDNLIEGGTTPSAGAIELICARLAIPVNVMIRPRGGDFLYSDLEFAIMRRDVEIARGLGAAGVVVGLLNAEGTVDEARVAGLVALARPLSVTFHRAFDMTCDPFAALDSLIALGIDRVLTSGQERSAVEGLDLLTALAERAGDRIIIMAGGGVNARNLTRVVARSGVREVHIAPKMDMPSGMEFRNPNTFMGAAFRPPEYSIRVIDADAVRACVDQAQR